jgi:hypothetical protein
MYSNEFFNHYIFSYINICLALIFKLMRRKFTFFRIIIHLYCLFHKIFNILFPFNKIFSNMPINIFFNPCRKLRKGISLNFRIKYMVLIMLLLLSLIILILSMVLWFLLLLCFFRKISIEFLTNTICCQMILFTRQTWFFCVLDQQLNIILVWWIFR